LFKGDLRITGVVIAILTVLQGTHLSIDIAYWDPAARHRGVRQLYAGPEWVGNPVCSPAVRLSGALHIRLLRHLTNPEPSENAEFKRQVHPIVLEAL